MEFLAEPLRHVASQFMIRNFARGCWRLLNGIRRLSFSSTLAAMPLFCRYFREWTEFRKLGGDAHFANIAPVFLDRSSKSQSGGGHYFYQDVWALRKLREFQPREHHDFGSRLDGFAAQATAICSVVYWDIRPPNFSIADFSFRQADILQLPVQDKSLSSMSCLHVVEHVGLGRYGDQIDPEGTEKALLELARVLAPGGQFLLGMPIGQERVEFNAHRIWNPSRPIKLLESLRLAEFSVITDEDQFFQNVDPARFSAQKFACGLYVFCR